MTIFSRKKTRRFLALTLSIIFTFSLAGCGKKDTKQYQTYVKSLIAINYLGATKDYINATGASEEDANALYDANVDMLARNLLTYYGINISDVPDLKQDYLDLARSIYSKVNYSVSKSYKEGSAYYVDVTIYPIDLFNQTADEITSYIEQFDAAVRNGDYNDTSLIDYETSFSNGMVRILNEGCLSMTYAEPVVVTVKIIEDGDIYYISDSDFRKIDAAMFATEIIETTSDEPQTVEE